MPIYLVHGFKWPRPAIRVHIILNNIDNAAPDYIVSKTTSDALLENLRALYPNLMAKLPNLRFLEQYDPSDTTLSSSTQPYAFIANTVESIQLSLGVDEVMSQGGDEKSREAMKDIRDKLAPQEKLGWWIVYNGDETRLMLDESQSNEEQKRQKSKLRKLLSGQR